MSAEHPAAQGQDMGYVGNVTGATHYDHSKGLNSLAASADERRWEEHVRLKEWLRSQPTENLEAKDDA